jgi:hypothetical protein
MQAFLTNTYRFPIGCKMNRRMSGFTVQRNICSFVGKELVLILERDSFVVLNEIPTCLPLAEARKGPAYVCRQEEW